MRKGIQKLEDKKEKLRSRKFLEEEPDENSEKGNPGRERITKEKRHNPDKEMFSRKGILKRLFEEGLPQRNQRRKTLRE